MVSWDFVATAQFLRSAIDEIEELERVGMTEEAVNGAIRALCKDMNKAFDESGATSSDRTKVFWNFLCSYGEDWARETVAKMGRDAGLL